MTTIGMIASGHVRGNLAKAAIAHGYEVVHGEFGFDALDIGGLKASVATSKRGE